MALPAATRVAPNAPAAPVAAPAVPSVQAAPPGAAAAPATPPVLVVPDPNAPAAPPKPKRTPAARVEYTGGTRNEKGQLTAVPPLTGEGAFGAKHKPLKKAAFADEATFFDFQASLFDRKAEKARKNAAEARQSIGGVDRKKAKKLNSLLEALAKLEAELGPEAAALVRAKHGELAAPAPAAAPVAPAAAAPVAPAAG